MSKVVTSRYRDNPDSAAQTLYGALGGSASVPFYYNLAYNLNRDGSGNVIQWADAVRGYSGASTPPVLTVPSGATAPTYDATKGVVSLGQNQALMGNLAGAFAISAGSTAGITHQAIGTVWVVGELDANPTYFQFLFAIMNGAGLVGCSVEASNANTAYSTQGRSGNFANSTVTATDGVCRLIVATILTGNYAGNQVPTHGALVEASNTTTVANEPYSLMLFGGGMSGTSVLHPGIGSIREIGALSRIATASDLTLLQNNAVALGATL